MKRNIIFVLFLFLTTHSFAQDSAPVMPETNKIAINRLANQIKIFPQEKVYLQLDKPYYSAGERLWFRIHMVHAAINTPFALSRYVYIELINANNEVIQRKKIRPTDEAIFFGQIDFLPEIAEGWYSIRAYTNFMRNVDENYFYRQKIYIGNALKGLSGVTVKENTGSYNAEFKTGTTNKADYDVQFFPEGGHLIAGNMQTICFKAISKNGLGTDISGRIIDDKNTDICTFKSSYLGMGLVIMMPEAGKKYTAICEDSHGQSLSVKLPEVSIQHYALSVQQSAAILNISVLSPNGLPRTDTLYLIGSLRGLPILQNTITPESPGFTFSKKGFNSGVTQFLLLNKKGEILSERLVYISGSDKANLSVKPDKQNYLKRDAVHASLLLKDSKGNPIEGNFSFSVTDNNDVKIDPNETTIESYLLLQSDLKGYIENPNAYFRTENKSASFQLDLLMLTQGWKRYNTASTLAGNYSKGDTYELERGPIISGKVQNFPARRGLPKANVSIVFHKNMHFDAVTTDNSGRFFYPSVEFPDSTKIMIQADKKAGAFVELIIDPDSFPKVALPCVFPEKTIQDPSMKEYLKKSRDRYNRENGMMSYNLENVVVTAKKVDKNKKIRDQNNSMYNSPSFSFNEETISTATSILDLLLQAPGISPSSDGSGVLLRNAVPLVMVDNMEYSMQDLQNVNVSEVQLIDILKDITETAMYGPKGSNGVICIYLKRGEDRQSGPRELGRHQAEITPLGFSMPAEFYVPKYQVEENKQSSIPDLRSTIYWKPNVKSNANGEADVYFYTADSPSTYTITAEGVTSQGEIIRYQGTLIRK